MSNSQTYPSKEVAHLASILTDTLCAAGCVVFGKPMTTQRLIQIFLATHFQAHTDYSQDCG